MEVDLRALPLLLLALCVGCAQSDGPQYDSSTPVERVLEDVSAMIEGMAAAHNEQRVVLRGPEFRSTSPRDVE